MTKTYCLYGLIAGLCLFEGGSVRAQGGPPAPPTQNVNVVNTPTVNVAGIPTVAIAGTQTVAVAGFEVNTVKIFDELADELSTPINVGAFKQIRIAAAGCNPGSIPPTVRLFVLLGNDLSAIAQVGDNLIVSCQGGSSATYDLPGELVVISVNGSPIRVVMFGRAN